MRAWVVGALCAALAAAAPVSQETAVQANDGISNMDLSMTVFDQNSASNADQNQNYVIFAYDDESCDGEKASKCKGLESALSDVIHGADSDPNLSSFKGHFSFGKANKDRFPDHKKDFEKAKVPLPAVLFWPAGHSRPSCKYDADGATGEDLSKWLSSKLKEEAEDDDDDALLQLDEGGGAMVEEDDSMKFCDVNDKPADFKDSVLVQTEAEKTQQIYSYKSPGGMVYVGPADNSLPKDVTNTAGEVKTMNAAAFQGMAVQNKYMLLYFKAEWCKYCGCLPAVFDKVAGNLIVSKRQPNLMVAQVDGDNSPALRDLFKVEVYPTIVLVNRDATKVLGRYLGPRKVFEISTWAEDLIVADENPIVNQEFSAVEDKPDVHDQYPVFPYEGKEAFGETMLLQSTATLMGNDEDECTDMDEAKFTAPGAALFIKYDNEAQFELDQSVVSTDVTPNKVTVIDFYQPWCPHCNKLHPTWDALAADFKDKDIVVGKVNCETHPEIKKMFHIKKYPTIMYFEAGQPMTYDEDRRYRGKRSLNTLEHWVSGLVSTNGANGITTTANLDSPVPLALKSSDTAVETNQITSDTPHLSVEPPAPPHQDADSPLSVNERQLL